MLYHINYRYMDDVSEAMTIETETYINEQAWRDAMKRRATRPSTGWKMLSNSRLNLTIEWSDALDVPKPPVNMTQREFIDLLATERNINIT